jgi:hypothetical protein
MKRAITLLVALVLPLQTIAANHGPVFGLATPTNSQGEWSFDQGIFGRSDSWVPSLNSRTCRKRFHTPSHAVVHATYCHR